MSALFRSSPLQPTTHISLSTILVVGMALFKKPNDYLIGELLAKQAERDCNLTLLLWAFARRDHSVLDSEVVETFTTRIGRLRYRISQAYKSRVLDRRILDDLVCSRDFEILLKYAWPIADNAVAA